MIRENAAFFNTFCVCVYSRHIISFELYKELRNEAPYFCHKDEETQALRHGHGQGHIAKNREGSELIFLMGLFLHPRSSEVVV
jgi:hypothetical protein